MASLGFSLAARFIQLVLGFLNVMLISRYLGPQQYGNYTFVISFVLLFTPLIDLSLNHIITREISQNGNVSLTLIKASVYIRLSLILIVFPIILFCAKIFLPASSGLIYFILIYSLVLLNYCFGSANSYFIAAYELQFPSVINILINISNTLTLFLSINLKLGLFVIFLSQALFPVINALIIYFRVSSLIILPKVNPRQLNFCLKEIKYLTIAGIFTTLYFRLNSAIVFKFLGPESTGIFNSAYKFIDVTNPIVSVLMMTIFPKMNDIISKKEKGLTINDLVLVMLFLGAFTSLFVFNFSDLIIRTVYGSGFIAGVPILRILALSFSMIFVGNVTGFLMIAHRMQKQYMTTSISAAVINIVMLFCIIPSCGTPGAAVVAVLTELFALSISFSYLVKNSFSELDTRYLKILVMTMFFLIFSSVNVILYKSQLVSVFLVILFITLCVWFRIIPLAILQKVFYEKRISYNTNI